MTKVTLPEPVVEFRVDQMGIDHDHLFTDEITHLDAGHYKAITTTQAEAYADARVREALEEAMRAVADPVLIEASIENFYWASAESHVQAHRILIEAQRAIRALIPPLPGPVEP